MRGATLNQRPNSLMGGSTGGSMGGSMRAWLIGGLLLGALLALVHQAPAAWLARLLERQTAGHVLLAETRGTLWAGSGELVLTGGAGSRDASRLPGRVHWQLGWGGGLLLRLRLDCCSAGELPLRLQAGLGHAVLSLPNSVEPLLRLPAAWLGGLGTPWNTLQLGGQLRLASREFQLEWRGGRWQPRGQLDLDLVNLSSRISTLAPLGSYRFSLRADWGTVECEVRTVEPHRTLAYTWAAHGVETVVTWTLTPAGTPAPVLAKLRAAVGEILQDRENVQKMHKLGLEPGDTDGAALSKRISSDIARWRRVAKAANIQPQ